MYVRTKKTNSHTQVTETNMAVPVVAIKEKFAGLGFLEPSSSCGFKRTMVNLSQAKVKKQKPEEVVASAAASKAEDGEGEAAASADMRKDLLKQFMQLNNNMQKMLESL